jgi:hypothetical protein
MGRGMLLLATGVLMAGASLVTWPWRRNAN